METDRGPGTGGMGTGELAQVGDRLTGFGEIGLEHRQITMGLESLDQSTTGTAAGIGGEFLAQVVVLEKIDTAKGHVCLRTRDERVCDSAASARFNHLFRASGEAKTFQF